MRKPRRVERGPVVVLATFARLFRGAGDAPTEITLVMAVAKERKLPPTAPVLGTDVEFAEVSSQGASWFERNGRYVAFAVGIGILVALGIFLYQRLIQEPARLEAATEMWRAEQLFEQDSFQVALQGRPGSVTGFIAITEDYGSTPSGNLANYYAGVSYLYLGQYAAAISYLEDFDAEGTLLPAAKAGALGDAHAQNGDLATAEGYYEDAVDLAGDNLVTAPYYIKKLAMLRERNGDKASALELYERIRTEFPTSTEAQDIGKFTARASG